MLVKLVFQFYDAKPHLLEFLFYANRVSRHSRRLLLCKNRCTTEEQNRHDEGSGKEFEMHDPPTFSVEGRRL